LQQIKSSGRMSQGALLSLWRRYKQDGDLQARDRLVLSLAPIVKAIVYRKLREIPGHCEVEDYISCGLEALIRSIDRYDPDKGATLEQFAWTRIHGAVLDELRASDWAPRSLRRTERELNRTRDRFTVLHGRAPTTGELSEAMAMTEEGLIGVLHDLERSEIGSLNTLVTGEDEGLGERLDSVVSLDASLDPEQAAMRERAVARFRLAFDELSARERRVALLLHVGGLTLKETGEVLGVSESRVCQIHSKLKRSLRERLEADRLLMVETP
jgi:RNA polymerase sigma factor for flagellar operon FliA